MKNPFLKRIGLAAALSISLSAYAADTALPVIKPIKLSVSNAFLVKADHQWVLVDCGSKGDLAQLQNALKAEGTAIEQLSAVILTHGHQDHAGLAAEIKRRSGAVIVAGAEDVPMLRAGHIDELKPMNFTGRLLKRFAIDPVYEGLAVDVAVSAPFDLRRFGIAGTAMQMPGHTAGSLVVVLDDGRALVGDIMLGGWLNGEMRAEVPGESYFQANPTQNHGNLLALLKRPIHTFYLGHGGPVTRAAVLDSYALSDPLAQLKASN